MTSLGSAQLRSSDSQTRDDLAPPPPLITIQLERTSSSPSSFSSSTVLASPPLSPEEIGVGELNEQRDTGDKLAVATKTRQVRTSISMDGLKGNPAAFHREAMRSRSGSNPTSVVMPRPAQRVPSPPRPVITTTQSSRSARTDAQKSSGGFASFLRRLTGRSASPPKTKSKTISIPPSANSQARPVMPVTMERSASADASSASRARSTRPTLSIETPSTATTMSSTNRPGPLTAPAAPQPSQILPGPTPLSPQQISVTPAAEIQPRPTDPCEIPLPPSPLAAPLSLPTASEPPSELLLSPMTPMSPSALKAPTIRRTHPSGMLSLEGFEEESASDLTDEASESEDMVHDLKPIRIPSNGASARSNASANSVVGPATPASVNSTYDEIVTPSSAHGSSPDFHARYAGSSPPRKAPIGTGAGTGDLGRKGSKWRKSVMGLSDHLGGKAVSRKQSTRVPPSSYDAYEAHQRRIANNRSSCAPTLHSTASIAAELREIKDKEESDRAETFFLS